MRQFGEPAPITPYVCGVGKWQGLRFLKGHTESITAMEGLDGVAGHKGRALVGTGSIDKTVRIWDARARKAKCFRSRGTRMS